MASNAGSLASEVGSVKGHDPDCAGGGVSSVTSANSIDINTTVCLSWEC